MSFNLDRRTLMIGLGAAAGSTAFSKLAFSESHASAEGPQTFEIEMLNRDPDNPRQRNVFLPRIQVANPGDTIKFVATDRGHNALTIADMVPEGAEGWKGKLNEEIEVTLETPGAYGYLCTPHSALGMVGLILVKGEGLQASMETAKAVKHRGRAASVWEEIWAEVESENLLG
ncbi:MAG: pseudoazurin [Pseudomonadota bacterium]